MLLYDIINEGMRDGDGPFRVEREDGKRVTVRARIAHAIEVRDALLFGNEYPTEAQQIIRDHAKLFLREDPKMKRPFKLVDSFGVVVRRFKYDYLAKWWLKQYRAGKMSPEQRGAVMKK
jgi:hypothetical protein